MSSKTCSTTTKLRVSGSLTEAIITETRHPLVHSFMLTGWNRCCLCSHRNLDLARMYSLLARIPEGLDPLRKRFEEHVKKVGLAAIEKLSSSKGGAAGKDGEEEGEADDAAPKGSAVMVRNCLSGVSARTATDSLWKR